MSPLARVILIRLALAAGSSLVRVEQADSQGAGNAADGPPERTFKDFVDHRMSLLGNGSISLEDLDRAVNAKTTRLSVDSADRVRVLILGGKIYARFPNEVFHFRHRAFFEGLIDLASTRALPNVEFVAHMADEPPCSTDQAANGVPIMTWSTQPGCRDMPIPCWTLLQRGYRAGTGPWSYQAMMWRKGNASFHDRETKLEWDLDDKSYRRVYGFLLKSPKVQRTPVGQYDKFKLAAHIEGFTYSARMKNILLSGSIPVFFTPTEKIYREYWHAFVQPGVHYLRIPRTTEVLRSIARDKPDGVGQEYFIRKFSHWDNSMLGDPKFESDVEHSLDEMLALPNKTLEAMAERGFSRVSKLLHPDKVLLFLEVVLREYHEHQTFEPGASRLKDLDWVEISNAIMDGVRNTRLPQWQNGHGPRHPV